jgi:hypothetical protein
LTQSEQHVRSFLEVMPFGMIPLMVLLHRPIGKDLRLVRRSPFLSRDFAYLGVLIVAGGILPYWRGAGPLGSGASHSRQRDIRIGDPRTEWRCSQRVNVGRRPSGRESPRCRAHFGG